MNKSIFHEMIVTRPQYYIAKVKAPLLKGLLGVTETLVKPSVVIKSHNRFMSWVHLILSVLSIVRSIQKYPEPTRENITDHNSLVLFDLWDEFIRFEGCKKRIPLWLALRRLSVSTIAHDRFYHQRMTRWVRRLSEEYNSGNWLPLYDWQPETLWNEPSVVEAYRRERQDYHLLMVGLGLNEGK